MARKNLKWQVHEAVMDSNLTPAARLLMFVFSDLADAETGKVPEERRDGTTIAELARRTGLGPATVKRHKPDLVELGWLIYKAPTGKQQSSHETGTYAIAIGRDQEPKAVAQDEPPAVAQSEPPQSPDDEETVAHGEPGGGSQRATPVAQDEPPIKETNTNKNTNTLLGPNADASAPSSRHKRAPKKPKAELPPRPDVDALCQRLAELMIANECKPPTITQHWRDEARRLLDLDGRDFDKAMHLLDWTQQHKFWRKNILSMPKFREKYDQLRLDALAEWEGARNARSGNGYQPYDNPTDPNAYSGGIQ